MMFYVFIEPEIVGVAQQQGPYAVQSFISILRGFQENCLILDFEDQRVRRALGKQVEHLPNDADRTAIKRLLVALQKRNRFTDHLAPDYEGKKLDLTCALEQVTAARPDLLLLSQPNGALMLPIGIEVATLSDYQWTQFEHERARLANEGRTSKEGEFVAKEFLDLNFAKAFRFASRIEICDRMFGKFADNYKYTAKMVIQWMAGVLADPRKCRLIFHCAKPDGNSDHHLLTQLGNFGRAHLPGMPMEVHFYQLPASDNVLPHERFIVSDQVALEIGRGMDFLSEQTGKNRDVSIGYKSMKEVDDLLRSYAAGRLPVIAV